MTLVVSPKTRRRARKRKGRALNDNTFACTKGDKGGGEVPFTTTVIC